MLRFVTTADTEILATAAAVERLPGGLPRGALRQPGWRPDPAAFVDDVLDGARVVLCRMLGGRRGWPEGLRPAARALRRAQGIALLALGGEAEPDAEMTGAVDSRPAAPSPRPASTCATATSTTSSSCCASWPTRSCSRATASTPPREVARPRRLRARAPATSRSTRRSRGATRRGRRSASASTARTALTGNTAFVDALCARDRGRRRPTRSRVWSYTLRRDADGRVPALELLGGHVDALITTMLATGGSSAGDARRGGDGVGEAWQDWDASALAALGVPVIQAVCAHLVARGAGRQSDSGPDAARRRDAGRDPRVRRAAARRRRSRSRSATPSGSRGRRRGAALRARPRALRAASRGWPSHHARLRHAAAPTERRVAVLLTSFPTKHAQGRHGGRARHARQRDRAARRAARATACASSTPFADGDALMHALIATGGHDPEFLTDDQLAAAPLRLPVADYLDWYADAARGAARGDREQLGPAAGRPLRRRRRLRDRRARARQRARRDPAAARLRRRPGRHLPRPRAAARRTTTSPATGGSSACWGADAIVHLGKHGTLEWLPGKTLGALGEPARPTPRSATLPLVYPFVVNDPGEGVQAKRRAHAVIVDHLVPPMMRADTYDEMAELEALLDEYARLRGARPVQAAGARRADLDGASSAPTCRPTSASSERPDGRRRRSSSTSTATCARSRTSRSRTACTCSAARREGEQLRRARVGHPAPRLGRRARAAPRRRRGLRARRAGAGGGGRRAGAAGAGRRCVERFRGPTASAATSSTGSRTRSTALLDALADARLATRAPRRSVCADVLGRGDAGVERALRFAGDEVVPRHPAHDRRARPALLGARCSGRHVPAGPVGRADPRARRRAPDRAQLLLASTRARCPPSSSWEVGAPARRRAARPPPRRDGRAAARWSGSSPGARPRCAPRATTSAEILALLGVRPDLAPGVAARHRPRGRSRSTSSAGRASTSRVRISGFFRDAFPHLVRAARRRGRRWSPALDEPAERQLRAPRTRRADAERLAAELGDDAAWRRATTRVFGSKPGHLRGRAPAAARRARLARRRRPRGGLRGLGRPRLRPRPRRRAGARRRCASSFARIEVAVKNVDSREHDILDSDDYYAVPRRHGRRPCAP